MSEMIGKLGFFCRFYNFLSVPKLQTMFQFSLIFLHSKLKCTQIATKLLALFSIVSVILVTIATEFPKFQESEFNKMLENVSLDCTVVMHGN